VSIQERRKIQEERVIPVHNEKILFFRYYIVVLFVKLIHGPGIGNDELNERNWKLDVR
jgi:hypothetical protein